MYVLLNVGCRANLSDKANNPPFPDCRNEAEQPCCNEHNVFPCCFYFSCVSQVERVKFYKNLVCEAWCKAGFIYFLILFLNTWYTEEKLVLSYIIELQFSEN